MPTSNANTFPDQADETIPKKRDICKIQTNYSGRIVKKYYIKIKQMHV